ncbi:hypothetical protein V1525DRAFT_427787 [Lipomyces kononenkoae]|uniref:Uncharacterized protein n=1 Tax=Lipomyces kononenkoae TaxID=34357 RepID=A0ACC3SWI8_LIPKO
MLRWNIIVAALFILVILVQTVSAHSLRGFLDSTVSNGRLLTFSPSTEVVLRSAEAKYKTYVRADGTSFVFLNVTAGSYALSVNSAEHVFPTLRVDVATADVEVFLTHPGNEWSFKGPRQPYPIELRPFGPAVYYQYREGFNVLKLFKNPMLMISLLTLGMVFVLPKIMDSMDPEQLKEIQQEQAKSVPSALANPMNFDVASYLAGKASGPSSGSSASHSKAAGSARSRKS